MQKFLQRYVLVPLTQEIDAKADTLIETYSLSHNLEIPDALIAATAMVYDCPLLSKNQRDYRYISGLHLLAYP
jgi:predicted nucleic acid-binding protein